jgi:hypothetical protein
MFLLFWLRVIAGVLTASVVQSTIHTKPTNHLVRPWASHTALTPTLSQHPKSDLDRRIKSQERGNTTSTSANLSSAHLAKAGH